MKWDELAVELDLQEVELKALVALLEQDPVTWKALKNQINLLVDRETGMLQRSDKWEKVLRAQGACQALKEVEINITKIIQRVREEGLE